MIIIGAGAQQQNTEMTERIISSVIVPALVLQTSAFGLNGGAGEILIAEK